MKPRTIDMTPTWAAIMPAIVACLQSGTAEGRRIAAAELYKLAEQVDALNAAPAPVSDTPATLADTFESWAKANASDARNAGPSIGWPRQRFLSCGRPCGRNGNRERGQVVTLGGQFLWRGRYGPERRFRRNAAGHKGPRHLGPVVGFGKLPPCRRNDVSDSRGGRVRRLGGVVASMKTPGGDHAPGPTN